MHMIKLLMQIRIRHMEKRMPSSSATAENTKSASTSGIDVGFPLKSPRPNHPPLLMPNRDWAFLSYSSFTE